MFISTKAISRHCTADLAIKGDESLQGTTFKKNDGEKENNSSSTQKGVKKVKQNGNVKFEGKWYHVGRKMTGETVDVKITLKRVEVWHNGAYIKRWKYWEYVLSIAAGYMVEKYLL